MDPWTRLMAPTMAEWPKLWYNVVSTNHNPIFHCKFQKIAYKNLNKRCKGDVPKDSSFEDISQKVKCLCHLWLGPVKWYKFRFVVLVWGFRHVLVSVLEHLDIVGPSKRFSDFTTDSANLSILFTLTQVKFEITIFH